MADADVNLVKNPRFDQGKKSPRYWSLELLGGQATWEFDDGRSANGDRSVCLRCCMADSGTRLIQRLSVAGDQYYRIEATVRCDLRPDRHKDGLRILFRALDKDKPIDEPTGRESWQRVGQWSVLRDYYQTPEEATHLEVEVRLEGVAGRAWVDDVRVIPVDEPEYTSHPFAVPPPSYAYPAPKRVKRIMVMRPKKPAADGVDVIAGRFGTGAVGETVLADFARNENADAVILQGIKWSGNRPSWKKLARRANNQLVVISTALFAEVVNGGGDKPAVLRTNQQPDDPIHASVIYANFLTRGYALGDVLPWRWEDERAGMFVQRFIRKSKPFTQFCKDNGIEIILHSEGDADATSGHPVCLYMPGGDGKKRGGLVVMDLEPLGSIGGDEDAANSIAHILFNALGAEQGSLGQYTCPERSIEGLEDFWREMRSRFPEINVQTLDPAPRRGPRWQMTFGRQGEQYGLPDRDRPAILLRSGFCAEDWAGMYGVLYWLKELLRPEPFACRYLAALSARHRVVWFPVVRPDRWMNAAATPAFREPQMEAEFSPGQVALALDVTASIDHTVRAVVPSIPSRMQSKDSFASRLCALHDALGRGRFYSYGPAAGSNGRDRDSYRWRWEDQDIAVAVEPDRFANPYHRAAIKAGAKVLRLELPGGMDIHGGHSIWRTDRAACFVEWAVGALMGAIAVNRDQTTRRIDLGPWKERSAKTIILAPNGQTASTGSLKPRQKAEAQLSSGQTWIVTR